MMITKKKAFSILATVERSLATAKEAMAFAKKSEDDGLRARRLAKDTMKFSNKVMKTLDQSVHKDIKDRGFMLKAINLQNKQMWEVELFLKTLKTPAAAKAIRSLNVADKAITNNFKKAGFKPKASK